MTRSEMTLNKAIRILKEEYTKAQAACYVRKPMSYALYQTWKCFDGKEKSRIKDKEETEDAGKES